MEWRIVYFMLFMKYPYLLIRRDGVVLDSESETKIPPSPT